MKYQIYSLEMVPIDYPGVIICIEHIQPNQTSGEATYAPAYKESERL